MDDSFSTTIKSLPGKLDGNCLHRAVCVYVLGAVCTREPISMVI